MTLSLIPTEYVQFREASIPDIDSILHCLSAAFEPYRERYTPGAFADTVLDRAALEKRMREMSVVVAVASGRVVGTIAGAAHGTEGHLRGMAVLPEQKGSGVAAQLLREIEDRLRSQGCTHITLDTTLPLERAIRFYEKHGYSRSGHVAEFFSMPLIEYAKAL